MPEHYTSLLLALAAILIATKLLGELAQRMGQPAVLGELVAGILLGPSVLGVLDPGDPVLAALAELGVLLLLLQIGLHTDLRSILRVGLPATAVGLAGIVLPFGLGFLTMRALGFTGLVPVVCAAALTATSIGISARVLADLGRLQSLEGRIVLGAAVLDDVVGLIILSVVAGMVSGAALTIVGVSTTAAIAIGFIVAALLVGRVFVPPFLRLAGRLRLAWALGALALALALGFAGVAGWAGSATIIGAFAAGLVLHATPQRDEIERATTSLGHFFVPIFFAVVGSAVDLSSLANPRGLAIGGALAGVGVLGKFLAGFAPWWVPAHRPLIGVAMIPRGEVGLIFAQLGRESGVLDAELFSAVLLMVMVTTLVAPPALAILTRRTPPTPLPGGAPGGLDELVAGEREALSEKRQE
ncbi:MAG: cation:proton antiporter [Gemmatimonadales bacterium]